MRRDVFQAIADPTRREIINLLVHKSLNLNGIADNFNISRPAISKHIKILTECGLVVIKQSGTTLGEDEPDNSAPPSKRRMCLRL